MNNDHVDQLHVTTCPAFFRKLRLLSAAVGIFECQLFVLLCSKSENVVNSKFQHQQSLTTVTQLATMAMRQVVTMATLLVVTMATRPLEGW